MKTLNFLLFSSLFTGAAFSQNTFPTTAGVNAGWGITSPNFNIQIHGTTNYVHTTAGSYQGVIGGGTVWVPGTSVDYGITSRFGLTNTNTGSTAYDGALFRMSGLNFMLQNQENGNLEFKTNNTLFVISGSTNRMWLGGTPTSSATYANFNVESTDNGMYIKSLSSVVGKYGLGVKMASNNNEAIQVSGAAATKTFSVKGSGITEIFVDGPGAAETVFTIRNSSRKLLQVGNDGILRSREIIVDLLTTWPDYVFKADYKLMPLEEVSGYIKQEGHLPNVPAATTVEAEGINVAQMNKLLMEKVEELTLYLIQQDEHIKDQDQRIKALESNAGQNK